MIWWCAGSFTVDHLATFSRFDRVSKVLLWLGMDTGELTKASEGVPQDELMDDHTCSQIPLVQMSSSLARCLAFFHGCSIHPPSWLPRCERLATPDPRSPSPASPPVTWKHRLRPVSPRFPQVRVPASPRRVATFGPVAVSRTLPPRKTAG